MNYYTLGAFGCDLYPSGKCLAACLSEGIEYTVIPPRSACSLRAPLLLVHITTGADASSHEFISIILFFVIKLVSSQVGRVCSWSIEIDKTSLL